MIKADVVAHSINSHGDELVSVLCTFPRIILAEVNTHRMLSKNTSSSRAIPFPKMLETIKTNPFIPIAWQKEHKGMQGTTYFEDPIDIAANIQNWLIAKDRAVETAIWLDEGKVTKQLCNRLLEPFMWTTMLITGTRNGGGWDNFFNLRCPQYHYYIDGFGKQNLKSKREVLNAAYEADIEELNSLNDIGWLKLNKGMAEIHMMALAECIYDAINTSTPKHLNAGEWHIPFNDKLEHIEEVVYGPLVRVKVSTAMGARTSYTTIGEEKSINYETLIELDDRLINQDPPHSSPMEHCAITMTDNQYYQHMKGDFRSMSKVHIGGISIEAQETHSGFGWCRNFKGFIQRRDIIENK